MAKKSTFILNLDIGNNMYSFFKSTTLIVLCMTALGCTTEEEHYSEPSSEDLRKAFERAIVKVNKKMGADISSITYDWIEVPSNCYGELDYFAQQFLWAYVYQEYAMSKNTFFVDCSIAEKYRQLSIKK